jgi:hypothetical protein
MKTSIKCYQDLLEQFTLIMHKHDPCGCTQDSPEDEYVGEALSILAAWLEFGTKEKYDDDLMYQTYSNIVFDKLHFWFGLPIHKDINLMIKEMYDLFINRYEEK